MEMSKEDLQRLAQFFFELGTVRKVIRVHRQVLLTDDLSDNIGTHSFRVAFIGYVLAKMAGADAGKVVLMCLTHDLGEARSNDHNWVHKRYVKIDEELIVKEQLGTLPFPDLFDVAHEYWVRQSAESRLAKDADVLDQILLLREYAHQGNKEAQAWLDGKRDPQPYNYTKYLHSEEAKALGRTIYDETPSSWWTNLYQAVRNA